MSSQTDQSGEPFVQTLTSFQEKCSLCGNVFPQDVMVRFGDKWVCAVCKPNYVQMVQQGLAASGQVRYGGFWIRLGARVIDTIILQVANYIVVAGIALVFAIDVKPSSPGQFTAMTLLQLAIALVLGLSYEVWFLGNHSATPGKMICGLKVVRPDGEKISYMRALGRYFATGLSAAIIGIGYIMAGFDSEKRALHDRVCDTRVVRR